MARAATDLTVTSTHLLEGLRRPGDETAWREYVDRYRDPVVRYAMRFGARRDDAEDIAQQTLIAFSTSFREGKYDREKGRLRDWLFGIARIQMLSWFRRQERQPVSAAGGDADALASTDDDGLRTLWEQEWRSAVLRACLARIRTEMQPSTYQAFELFTGRGWSAEQVAEHLGITPNAVFGAKRRILERLRALHADVEELW